MFAFGLKPTLTVIILQLLVVVSAFGIIETTHQSRQLFIQLQHLAQEEEALQLQWTQLLLEEGTWGSNMRVAKLARKQLKMALPEPHNVVIWN